MKQRFLSFVSVAILFLVLVISISCSKGGDTPDPPPPPPPPPDPGTISVNITESKESYLTFVPFTDVKSIDIFSIGRSGSNTNANNTAVTVKVEKKPELIEELNLTKGTNFEPLPDSLYTTTIVGSANVYTMNFSAGELSKKFSISANGAKWNLEHEYAMAFVVTEATGGNITSFKDTVITILSIRNKWDGVYTVTGTYSDVLLSAFTAYYPYEWELKTTGISQCVVIDKKLLGGVPGFLYSTGAGGGASFYPDFGLLINFDPATDKITSVTNYYGPPGTNPRSAELDPSGTNAYNSSSKIISVKYVMKHPNSVAAPPNIRARFNEEWTFSKAR